MISYHEALRLISGLAQSRSLGTEPVSLADAVGRVCSDEVKAGIDNPPFDNAAMDGFAVCLSDFQTACFPEPHILKISGILAAGQNASGLVCEGGCWQVMTGAPFPSNADAIVPVEEVKIDADRVTFSALPKIGQHIRRVGEDFKSGTTLLHRGQHITPLHILPLATAGFSHIQIFKKPKVLYLSTGAEIIDNLDSTLGAGQIFNSNKPFAQAYLQTVGADVRTINTLGDDPNLFVKVLDKAQSDGFDVVVSSGAVSAGKYDFVLETLKAIGADVLYHKVRMKPGKPNLLARLPSGAPYFGLPGNPVATAVGLRFFVREALRVMQRQPQEKPIFAACTINLLRKPGLHLILKSALTYSEAGQVRFEILDGQESFKTSPFLTMNSWAHIPEEHVQINEGQIFQVFPPF